MKKVLAMVFALLFCAVPFLSLNKEAFFVSASAESVSTSSENQEESEASVIVGELFVVVDGDLITVDLHQKNNDELSAEEEKAILSVLGENLGIVKVEYVRMYKPSDATSVEKDILFLVTLREKTVEEMERVAKQLKKNQAVLRVNKSHYFSAPEVNKDAITEAVFNSFDAVSKSEIKTGDSAIKVQIGILDSGIANHPALSTILGEGYDYVSNNNITTDDVNGHGTMVAGAIGAFAEENLGISNLRDCIELIPLQITYATGQGTKEQYVVRALEGAEERGIKIVNFSWGKLSPYEEFREAIDVYSGLFVCSAGNSGANLTSTPEYPASFVIDNKICVAALNSNKTGLASFSNYGGAVDIAALGEGVSVTTNDGGYSTADGTSLASPLVAGSAAYILSFAPNLSLLELKRIILTLSTKEEWLTNVVACGGQLNVEAAVDRAKNLVYTTEFQESGGLRDSFGQMSLWEQGESLFLSSNALVQNVGQAVLFTTNSYFDLTTTTLTGYQYKRLSSHWSDESKIATAGTQGVTIELFLKLDMSPIKEGVAQTSAKYGQTGFVVDVHSKRTHQEFYFAIAQKAGGTGDLVSITSFSGAREQINNTVPQEIICSIPTIETVYHKFVFSYDPLEEKITVYVDDVMVGFFGGPTIRAVSVVNQDFVCLSLVNRYDVNEEYENGEAMALSMAELGYLHIYNKKIA